MSRIVECYCFGGFKLQFDINYLVDLKILSKVFVIYLLFREMPIELFWTLAQLQHELNGI